MNGSDQSASVEEVYRSVQAAIRERRPISAIYQGRERKLCPHILGQNRQGRLQVLCYQYGGESQSGLQQEDRSANWRCIALEGLSDVRLLNEPWQTAEIDTQRQTCVEQIEMDVEDGPEQIRKKGNAAASEAGSGQS